MTAFYRHSVLLCHKTARQSSTSEPMLVTPPLRLSSVATIPFDEFYLDYLHRNVTSLPAL